MCKLRINMSEFDSMIRFYIAIFFMVFSVTTGLYPLLIVAIILIFTAIKRRCFIYNILGINKKIKSDNFYKNLYLENNTDIIIFLNEKNEILYSNKIESKLYMEDIFIQLDKNLLYIIIDNQKYTIRYRSLINNQIRLIELKK